METGENQQAHCDIPPIENEPNALGPGNMTVLAVAVKPKGSEDLLHR